MGDFFNFCLSVLSDLIGSLFGLSLGSYSYGDFVVALLVLNVFVTSLVISFRRANSNVGSAARPHSSKGGSYRNDKE